MIVTPRKTMPDLSPDERAQIRQEQISIAFKQSFPSLFPLFFAAIFVEYLFWGTPVQNTIGIWFGFVLVTLITRVVLLHRFWHNQGEINWSNEEKKFTAVMLASGIVWGSLGLFFFDYPNIVHQFFIFAMLASIGAVASGTIASLYSVAVIFLVALITPLATVMFLHGGFDYQIMGMLVLALLFLLVSAARRIHRNIMSALISKHLHEKALQDLQLTEEKFETIFKDAPAGIFYYDTDLIVIETNNEMLQILKISREKMIGLDLKILPDKCLDESLRSPITGEKGFYEGPYTSMINGLNLWISLRTSPIYNAVGEIVGGVGIVADITDRINAEEKIKHQAYFDALTNIPNRVLLKDRIEQSLAHYRRHRGLLAVMFLDLDHFKSVNDSLGHHIGDALLVETAQRLKAICREGDTVARLGGDEFVVLLVELGKDPHTAAKHAESVAEKIHEALSHPFELGQYSPIMTSSSIGIAIVSSDEQNSDDLLKFADTAMYQAKKEGRNTTRFYQEQMDHWIKKRLFMENALRNAVKNGELELYYQPVIEISTKKIIGAEALLRWNHPQMGLVMPDEMIEIAEESGLIVGIGEWVLREACTQFVKWRVNHVGISPIERIAINVSAVQFRQSDFVDKVIHIVAESGIVPSMLELELTESVIVDKIDTVIEKMKRLRKAGIAISMDDFGTGYSSLAYLKRLPFTTLKIDRTFVRDITIDEDDAALVETILSMASIFKLDVIAEGVETIEQFEFLASHGCQYFQGYLCSKPVQVPKFEELLLHDIQSCSSGV